MLTYFMIERLKDYIDNLKSLESERRAFAAKVRESAVTLSLEDAFEGTLVSEVPYAQFTGRVAAADASFHMREYNSIDMLLVRTVGAVFDYDCGKLVKTSYVPGTRPEPLVEITYSLEMHDVNWFKSLFRLNSELGATLNVMESQKPLVMLVDGALAPLLSDKPSGDSSLGPMYQDVIAKFKRVYETAEKSGIMLIGVIKDTRARRFMDLMMRKFGSSRVISYTNDVSMLNHILRENERTCSLHYSSGTKPSVMKDLGEWADKLGIMYLRASAMDTPIRLEHLSSQSPSKVAEVVLALSKINETYAYPAVLIEADLRALLDMGEVEHTIRSLYFNAGVQDINLDLRRNSRPFRQNSK
ncbi:hypothetical protein COX84_04045 [Candidatus Micrarchaeota archaeon CG_4_10_14_0_2_um_filter_49_7]|nr:MAG: hypothetical protein COX84_04045 [Candidatus Micrarchaeota archaeon CG_4_10_14_0_2_um_filter_49_7]